MQAPPPPPTACGLRRSLPRGTYHIDNSNSYRNTVAHVREELTRVIRVTRVEVGLSNLVYEVDVWMYGSYS